MGPNTVESEELKYDKKHVEPVLLINTKHIDYD